MSVETVIQIARQLGAEGKQPTVALIKARLPAPCPMPDVISGLQRWRQQASTGNQSETATAAQTTQPVDIPPNEDELAQLRTELLQVREEVARLREEVVMLRRSVRMLAAQAE